jgi:elongator complex protein 3
MTMASGFYAEMAEELKKRKLSMKEMTKLKHKLSEKYNLKHVPTNIEIFTHIPSSNLQTKPMRSQSGVTPIAVMTRPARCPHGKCTYCPGGIGSAFGDVPQSYTGNEPSTMRAIRNNYDPYLIVMNRIEQFVLLGHNPDKVELIIQGGTFPAEDIAYQESVIEDCFKAMNDFSEFFFDNNAFNFDKFKDVFELPGKIGDETRSTSIRKKLLKLKKESTLEKEHERNETAKIRCVGLTIETKPDWGLLQHGNEMLRLGCTRVEIGIQTIYDHVLKKVNRGHDMNDTYQSLQVLKDLGFKICAHMMPGLPDTTIEQDLTGLNALFTDERLRPDLLKIYPCHVAPGTPLYYEWKKGNFSPLHAEEAAKMLAAFKENIPIYCRVQRVLRDVPTKFWSDGVEFTNLRQYIHNKYKPKCKCIRCREPKNKDIDYDAIKENLLEYDANGGKEFFISLDDTTHDFIIGYCRLRFPGVSLREEITPDSAIIRELHVNGTAAPLGSSGKVQHRGFGKKLLERAETIAKNAHKKKMIIISGVGVREYYRKFGYVRDGPYMVKLLA